MRNNGYGVVYTPDDISEFVAHLVIDEYELEMEASDSRRLVVLDPACGEGALLAAVNRFTNNKSKNYNASFIGVDIEKDVIAHDKDCFPSKEFAFYNFNSILPSKKQTVTDYWRTKIPSISLIIANPPWSSEKVFSKEELCTAGYTFDVGQYDSYVLFVELCLKIIEPNGWLAFIIPDSIFAGENQQLRKYLAENTELRVIARLGEKLFAGVNRATTVLVLKKAAPHQNSVTKCFRLNTDQRKAFLDGRKTLLSAYHESMHMVQQNRFRTNAGNVFDIDTQENEESLLSKLEEDSIDWKTIFHFGRGVEIAKSGSVVICPKCNAAQGYSKKQLDVGEKKCTKCGATLQISIDTTQRIIETQPKHGFNRIYVGENVRRYELDGACYIKMGVNGINYKEAKLYEPPKILIRKTGLGINACIDNASTYISQTVYSCNYLQTSTAVPLAYYLGVLNSRILYYYYLKKYGENEWKSHPYITKDILFSLPIRAVSNGNASICQEIAKKAEVLQRHYSRAIDLEIEHLVALLYGITAEEMRLLLAEINKLPDLGAINHMKFREDEQCFDI